MADGGHSVGLVRYEAMCRAIAECVRVDEAQDIRNKSLALEAYYRQARNLEAEREAANIRLRAERRVGELLKELARADTARGGDTGANQHGRREAAPAPTEPPASPYRDALERQGISTQAASRFQRLADIPAETFERALSAPVKPSTAGMLREHDDRSEMRQTPRTPLVSDDALGLWGTLRDFERQGLLGSQPRLLLAQMTDAMRADIRRLAPLITDLLAELEACLEPA